MKQATINLYTISELSPKAQAKALDWYRQRMEYYGIEDTIIAAIHAECDERGISFEWDGIDHGFNLAYNLGFCQGDYVGFSGTMVWQGHSIVVKYHERRATEIESDMSQSDTDAFKEIYESICKAAMHAGHEDISYQSSDAACFEACEACEYLFLESGARAPRECEE